MKKISCFGYGITTKAIAKKLGPCTFYDDHVTKPFKDECGNLLKPITEFDPRYSTLEIPSPGMPPQHPLIQKAQHLMSEYDFFANEMPFSIWITGTNGKTTTTQMMQHLLKERGSQAGGNIGTPLADLDTKASIWILETSSFTLHYTHQAKPNIYVVLPITPDHLDWHGGFENYEADKLKPLAQMQEGEAVILPRKYAHIPTSGFKILYDDADDLAQYFGFKTKKIRFQGAFLLDAVIAMGMDKILFDSCDYEKMNAFIMDPHRQEEFYDKRDRLWVNDTKATNIDATLEALKVYQKKELHLILGGDDKGVDLRALFEHLQSLHVTLYLIGTNQDRTSALALEFTIPFLTCKTLQEAVHSIHYSHTQKSVALLSPAASSLDQFPSYAVRGETFKEEVHKLS
ncbi:MAG: UDP-N-acetylmuramoyl-L-alanine--D-glutamate ligase [Campylobacterota bacterium]|nr:UDP-N-acetylmuramoyl-L-alanine--D-glutamate ligase [Campylobacterota bacterium]